ncbi:MAG: type VI secretion system tube protein Hcp [Dehalococcoidia bacterium]
MKIDGIAGEANVPGFVGEVELLSFSWGERQVSGAAQALGTSKVSMQDLNCVKRTDKSSPDLFIACATGRHIKEAVISVARVVNSQPVVFQKVTFTDIVISSYNLSGGGTGSDPNPMEEVSINFTKVQMTYTAQLPGGGPDTPITRTFDLKANKPN